MTQAPKWAGQIDQDRSSGVTGIPGVPLIEGLLDRQAASPRSLEADHASLPLRVWEERRMVEGPRHPSGWLSSTAYCSPWTPGLRLGFFQEDFRATRVDLLVAGLGELERRRRWGRRFGSHGTQIWWKLDRKFRFPGRKGRLGGFVNL